jgi:hypothetical protein
VELGGQAECLSCRHGVVAPVVYPSNRKSVFNCRAGKAASQKHDRLKEWPKPTDKGLLGLDCSDGEGRLTGYWNSPCRGIFDWSSTWPPADCQANPGSLYPMSRVVLDDSSDMLIALYSQVEPLLKLVE